MAICVQPCLLGVLSEHLYYDEIAVPFTRMQNECKQLISLLSDAHIDIGNRINCSVFTIDQASDLVSRSMPHACPSLKSFLAIHIQHSYYTDSNS